MKRLLKFAAVMAIASGCGAVLAQTLKPGLWEISNRMQGENGEMEKAMAQMQKQMAAMPPEQRKMMEAMLAKQGVGLGASGTAVKVCMTREMVERNQLAVQQGDCKTTSSPRSGNTMKIAYTCAQPPSSGEGQVTFAGDTAYTMNLATTSTVRGKVEKMTLNTSGKWLSADCGAIKPITSVSPPGK